MKKRLKNAAILTRSGPGFMGGALLVILAIISPIHAGWLVEDQRLEGSDVVIEVPGAYYGETVAVSGDTAVVSARFDNEEGNNSGAAYVFVRTGSTWREQAKLKAPDIEEYAYFSSSVAISGDMIVVGASGKEVVGASEDSGKVYIFTRNGTEWHEESSLELPVSDRAAYKRFGELVAVSEDTVVIMALGKDGAPDVAYVYTRSGTTWTEQARLDDVELNYYSTRPVAISGDTIVVANHSSTSVFVRGGTAWIKQVELPVVGSVAISGDTIVIGNSEEAVAYVYIRSGITWTEQDALIGYEPNSNPEFRFYLQFGRSVAISGDTIVVGRPFIEDWGIEGRAYVYTRIGGSWQQQAALVAAVTLPQDGFGHSVSLDDNTVVVGSHGDREYLGSAYVFDITCNATYSLPKNQWRQISLPCDPGVNNTVTAVFGDDITGIYGTDWFIYRYEANGYVVLEPDDILSQGVGYWIIQTSDSHQTLDMPDNSTPTPVTSSTSNPIVEPTACLDFETAKGCFPIPLAVQANSVQWNMIGYPFISAGALGDAQIQTETGSCVSGCDLDSAHSQGIVYNQLWNYNGTNYTLVDTSGNLEPWAAYWLATLDQADGAKPKLLLPKP